MKISIASLIFIAGNSLIFNAQAQSQYDWSGFYGGVSVGAEKSADTYIHNVAVKENINHASTQPMYGAHLGYNYAIDKVVLGLELSYTSRVDGNDYASVRPPVPNRTRNFRLSNFLMLTPKIGYSFDRWHVYGKAGYAQADYDWYGYDTQNNIKTSSVSKRAHGWVAGFGADSAITKNLIGGIEFDYLRFNQGTTNITANPGFASGAFMSEQRTTASMIAARLSYKF